MPVVLGVDAHRVRQLLRRDLHLWERLERFLEGFEKPVVLRASEEARVRTLDTLAHRLARRRRRELPEHRAAAARLLLAQRLSEIAVARVGGGAAHRGAERLRKALGGGAAERAELLGRERRERRVALAHLLAHAVARLLQLRHDRAEIREIPLAEELCENKRPPPKRCPCDTWGEHGV